MAFFNKVGETISSKSKNLAAKAKELAEITSLNGQVNSQEENKERAYLEIGKKYYELHKEASEGFFAEQCTIIEDADKKIEELKDEIRKLKGIQLCQACGEEIPSQASFCLKCGEKVQMEAVEEAVVDVKGVELKVCPSCGKTLGEDEDFCNECGVKAKE